MEKITPDTTKEYDIVIETCRDILLKKMHDYGMAWRILRPTSLTDQIFIKAKRIRSLEVKGHSMVGEGILPEFMAIVNYGIIGLIQLELGWADTVDVTADKAMTLYDRFARQSAELMKAKNHDYDEAWRGMRVNSYTDFILTKVERIKEIEDNCGNTIVSEGVDSNYLDIINYAVFGIIKLTEDNG